VDSTNETAGRFLLELYRGTRSVTGSDFRKWALELLTRFVRFDSAFWGMGYMIDEIVVTAFTLHNQPLEMMVNYERWKELDPLVEHLACAPGTTIDMFDVISQEEFSKTEMYKDHSKPFGIEQTLATLVMDPVTRLLNAVSIYRSDPLQYFSPDEKAFMQFITPHLIEAATLNYFHGLLLEGEHGSSIVVSSHDGMLYQVESEVAGLLQREWPEWKGPALPEPLRQKVCGEDFSSYQGSHIRVDFQPRGDQCHLLLHEFGPFDRLTRRERQIAEQLAQGRPYKEIAREMGLAPSTVTNHANHIYRKLGVRNKAELARIHPPGQ